MRVCACVILVACVVKCFGQNEEQQDAENVPLPKVRNSLTEKIGNFSIELLYHTAQLQPEENNMIMSPFTVWTVLAVISEGAYGRTKYEINNALRIPISVKKTKDTTLNGFGDIAKWLRVNTSTVELAKFNGIFVDNKNLPLAEFQESAKNNYETIMVPLNFSDNVNAARILNTEISNFTHGRIKKIVESSYFQDAQMILTSALYFKGQWAFPFNATSTMKQPFYESNGKKIGEVNMMYNQHTYAYTYINALKARVIELPYGKENRLSMIIMLPDAGVSLNDMFKNFQQVSLNTLFEVLKSAKEEFSEDKVDCFIPRFKIESDIDLTDVLRSRMGIKDLFDMHEARLPYLARTPLYVSKVVHKAEIEVTEEGTTASAVTTAELYNRIGVPRFEANRPFTYMIIEKVTNSIVFGGFFKQPSLY